MPLGDNAVLVVFIGPQYSDGRGGCRRAPEVRGEWAALALHLVRSLPGATDDFPDPSHRLRIRLTSCTDRAEIV